MHLTDDLRRRLSRVRLLSLDLDGVLTDGGLYYTDAGDELRKFDVKDGVGVKAAMRAGVAVCILTTSTAPAIAHRARRLGVPHVFTGVEDKLPCLEALARQLGVPLSEAAHMADDINDLPVLRAVGLAVAPSDAVPAVRRAAALVTERPGGRGAVRELCDELVLARGAPSVFDTIKREESR